MWVSLWDQTWRIVVDPIRSQVYAASIPPSPCLKHSWLWWRETGCRLRPASASANAPIFIALEVLVSPSKEGTGSAGATTKFIRLTFVRPVERFLAQVI